MFPSFTYSAAVIPLVVILRPSVTQDLSGSSVTVELLDNRSMYCLGETARIRCDISGSDNDSSIMFEWIIGSTIYTPATIALPGHTVSPSDRFVLRVFQTQAYSANYSCSRQIGHASTASITIKSRAKLLTFARTTSPAPTVTCTNTTSNSVTVVVRDTNRCRAAKVTVAIIGRSNCFTTGHEVYLCAGLQAQTTYTISAVATTRMSNGSVLETVMDSTVCTTGAVKRTVLSIKGNDGGAVGALAALFTASFFIIIFLLCLLLICTVTLRKLKRKLHSQEVTASVGFARTSITVRGAEESSAMNENSGPVSKEEEVAQKDKKESNTVRGIVYADLDFGRRAHDQPIKPPPAFEKVQYADVS